MPQYLIIKPDGSWGYTSEKPKSGPIVTKEESDAYIATRGFSLNPEMGERQLAEERGLATATAPEPMPGAYSPYGLPNITGLDPNKFGARSRGPEESQAPLNYSNLYSPADQRKIEELERARSAISIDPTLDEDDRQAALDEVDVQEGRIPKLSPMMREPTAQEQVNQRIVGVIRGRNPIEYYYFDGKNPPRLLETNEETKARNEAYLKTYNKHVENLFGLKEKRQIDLSPKDIVLRAKYLADIIHKQPEEAEQRGPATRIIRGPNVEDFYFDKSGMPISLKELKKIYKGKREQWETLFDKILESLIISNRMAIERLTIEQLADKAESITNEAFEQEGVEQATEDTIPTIKTRKQYDALPSGTKYRDVNGAIGTKR